MFLEKDIFHLIYDNSLMPKRMTKMSAGFDMYVYGDYALNPFKPIRMGTGVALKKDFFTIQYSTGKRIVGKLYLRSGWSFKNSIIMLNSVGIIDMDYTFSEKNSNEIKFQVLNIGKEPVYVRSGERIGQIIFQPFYDFNININNERLGGFGSTGSL